MTTFIIEHTDYDSYRSWHFIDYNKAKKFADKYIVALNTFNDEMYNHSHSKKREWAMNIYDNVWKELDSSDYMHLWKQFPEDSQEVKLKTVKYFDDVYDDDFDFNLLV